MLLKNKHKGDIIVAIISFILTEVFAAFFFINKAVGNPDFNIVFKITASVFFVITPIFAYKKKTGDKKYFLLIMFGLIFSLFGDVLLAIKGWNLGFCLGVTAFTFAQIFFVIGFSYLERYKHIDLAIFGGLAIVLILLENINKDFNYDGKYIFILIYSIVISYMVAKAFSLLRIKKGIEKSVLLVIAAMVLFFLSDLTLLFVYFYKTKYVALSYANIVLYYMAQGILGLSFINPIKKLDKNSGL